MKHKQTLGDRVKTLRGFYRLSQASFGAKIKLSYVALANIENGTTKTPHSETIQNMVTAYGTTHAWLEGGEGEMLPDGAVDLLVSQKPTDNPYKDYAIQRLEKEAATWQQKYNDLFSMLTKVIDRSALGKSEALKYAGRLKQAA